MSALAHYLEADGLATTLIALVREHAAAIRPPRALWVPFELGRPFGAPADAGLQTRVLRAALALLDRPGPGPLLEDFEEPAPWPDGDPDWRFEGHLPTGDVLAEAAALEALWRDNTARRGRSTVGLSGFTPREAVEYIARFASDDPMPAPKGMAPVNRARFAIDDIKAAYLETAAGDNPRVSSKQLLDWFWETTLAGRLLRDFQHTARHSEDHNLRLIAGGLVPAERSRAFRGN